MFAISRVCINNLIMFWELEVHEGARILICACIPWLWQKLFVVVVVVVLHRTVVSGLVRMNQKFTADRHLKKPGSSQLILLITFKLTSLFCLFLTRQVSQFRVIKNEFFRIPFASDPLGSFLKKCFIGV
jgi:hypothetical protein